MVSTVIERTCPSCQRTWRWKVKRKPLKYGDTCHRCIAKRANARHRKQIANGSRLELTARSLVNKALARKGGSLTAADILPMLMRGICAKTGLEFVFEPRHPFSPSLDRIDQKLNYTPENVQVVCWQYNVAKNKWSDDQTLRFCRAVVQAADSPNLPKASSPLSASSSAGHRSIAASSASGSPDSTAPGPPVPA